MTDANTSSEDPSPPFINDEITFVGIALTLLRWRRPLFIIGLVGALAGLAFGLRRPRMYASTVIFVPQAANDQSASGMLALASSQLGIRIPSSGAGWGPPVYVELLQSRRLLEPIALDSLVIPEDGNARMKVSDFLEIPRAEPAQRIEKTIVGIRGLISVTEDKKLGAVRLRVISKRASVSFALAERLVSGVNSFNLKTRQSLAKAEREFVERQARQAELQLRTAEDRMQSFLKMNRLVSSPELTFQRDRLQRDITARQQEYNSLVAAHAEARIREVRDTPVITILEAPVRPAVGESRGSIQKAVLGGIIGVIVATIWQLLALGRYSQQPATQEFFDLLDDALNRIWHRRSIS